MEKRKQASLIGQLKDQLEEMEKCVAMVRLTLVLILHVLIEILEILKNSNLKNRFESRIVRL